MSRKPSAFDKILLNSIDEMLLSLGESARQSIYFHLEKSYNIGRNDIPADLHVFQMALEKIFGVGARYLEILIMKNLYSKIGQPVSMQMNGQLEFLKYVEAARQSYLQ